MRAERRFFVTFGPCSWILGSLQRTAADACAQKVFSTRCFILLVAPLSLAGSRSDAFVELNPLPMLAERRFFVAFGPCSWILGSLQRSAAERRKCFRHAALFYSSPRLLSPALAATRLWNLILSPCGLNVASSRRLALAPGYSDLCNAPPPTLAQKVFSTRCFILLVARAF